MKIFFGVLALTLFAFSRVSYADWSIGIGVGDRDHHEDRRDRRDDHQFYRWHDHPHYGWHMHYLPAGYFTIWAGGARYYYYDGLYYSYVGNGDYVLVNPPIGAYVTAIPPDFQPVFINGVTYYTDNGVYYILTRHHGYKVVAAPVVYAHPQPVVTTVTIPQVPATVVVQPAVAVQDTFPVNIPNNTGGYSTVVIKRSGNGYVGPQGEFYAQFPKVSQLKAMYGK
jgi:hypothetical protein